MQIQPGVCFTSIPFDYANMPPAGNPAVPQVLNIFHGNGFGFIIHAAGIDLPHSTLLKLKVNGINNVGNDFMWAAPNTWYWGPFRAIQVVPNDQLAFGESDVGAWVCDISIQPYAHVQPSNLNPGFAGIPAASGGSPPMNSVTYGMIDAGVKPTLFTDGIGLGSVAQLESVFEVLVDVNREALDTFIASGGIDLWRCCEGGFQGLGPGAAYTWYKVAENLLLITNEYSVGLTIDYFGPRKIGDRFYATPSSVNPVVTTPTIGTGLIITLRIE